MRKTNGENGWLCYFIAVSLILAGVFVEPLAAVLGILIVVASLISKLLENSAHKKMMDEAEVQRKIPEQAAEEKVT